jgi:hypothetical protein
MNEDGTLIFKRLGALLREERRRARREEMMTKRWPGLTRQDGMVTDCSCDGSETCWKLNERNAEITRLRAALAEANEMRRHICREASCTAQINLKNRC